MAVRKLATQNGCIAARSGLGNSFSRFTSPMEFGTLSERAISGLVDDIWECCLEITVLEHVPQCGAWRYSAVWNTHLSWKVLYEIKGSHEALQCLPWSGVFGCSTLLLWILCEFATACGLNRRHLHWVWDRHRYVGLILFDDENGIENSTWEFGTDHSIWLRRSVFCVTRCFGIRRAMPSSSRLVYLDVIDTGYINLMVWIFELNFAPYCLWDCFLTFHPEMRVGDYRGRYITTEQLYWACLHWGWDILHLGFELRDISMWWAECMFVCLYVCMSVCMSACLHVCMSVCLYVCMSVCLYVCMSVCLYVCMSVCLYVCMYVWMYGCMDVWMYVCYCMYVCMYVCM